MDTRPSIPEWFRNRKVLITGATGFVGKIMIYKLLMSCPDIGNIFLMIRGKKGVDTQSRLKVIIEGEPFRVLREKYPERLKKLVAIPAEITVDGLGLLDTDKEKLLKEISVVFHTAASVKFDLPLKTAVNTNTKSTMHVLAFAKQMPHLESFIHVSTAYCQCGETMLEERAYPTAISPESVISIVNTMPDDVLDAMTPKLLGKQPNTYAFSKSLSEDLMYRCNLPAGVARPSIVIASWKEPTPGWIDNINGPTGLMIGAGKGVIRTMLCNGDYLTDIMPCDIAVNSIIALAWHVGLEKPEKPIFMNVTESGENPISWNEIIEIGKKHTLNYPFSGSSSISMLHKFVYLYLAGLLWYPGGGVTSWKLLHWLTVLFLHFIPAYLLDAIIVLTGNKPFLVRVHQRITYGLELLQYYTTKEWIFLNEVKKHVQDCLSPSDKEMFFMDTKAISWDEYTLSYILGTRKYYLKDDPSTLPRARQILSYFYIADCAVKILFCIFIAWVIYSWMNTSNGIAASLIGKNEI
ncbi:hypothetical protein M0802_001993 [Mischocyttarus mexicanus]|nr:hypothetical protein M0802_001993 [Mischocyttarus mexicanus]